MQIPLDYLTDFIYQYLTMPVQHGMRWVARCPICGDSAKNPNKRRFGILYDPARQDGKAHCFNCGYSAGGLAKVICDVKHCTYRELQKEIQGNSLEILKGKSVAKIEENQKEDNFEFEDFSWILDYCIKGKPEGIYQTRIYNLFLKFKESRKVNYEMHCCCEGDFRSRVILPIYQDGKMVYFQARTLVNSDKKYKNPTSPKSSIIFNKDKWDLSKPIVITEGLLDAISIGNQGTMCLGASISDSFFEKLPDNVIISLDNDETGRASMLNLAKHSKFKSRLNFCVYPKSIKCKDLNEVLIQGFDVYNFVLENAVNSFKAQLLLH